MKPYEITNALIVMRDRPEMSRSDRDTLADACNLIEGYPPKPRRSNTIDEDVMERFRKAAGNKD